jgi:hypothetical protein
MEKAEACTMLECRTKYVCSSPVNVITYEYQNDWKHVSVWNFCLSLPASLVQKKRCAFTNKGWEDVSYWLNAAWWSTRFIKARHCRVSGSSLSRVKQSLPIIHGLNSRTYNPWSGSNGRIVSVLRRAALKTWRMVEVCMGRHFRIQPGPVRGPFGPTQEFIFRCYPYPNESRRLLLQPELSSICLPSALAVVSVIHAYFDA